MSFVHLHTHSFFSTYDGLASPDALAARAAEMGQPALAISDHGNVYAAFRHHDACARHGIKPIYAYEGYLALHPTIDAQKAAKERKNRHITLLAATDAGWQNLLKLASFAGTTGFYYKPLMTKEVLAAHADGIVCLSGCMSGPLSKAILAGDPDLALQEARWFREVFGGQYFIEVHEHGLKDEVALNKGLVEVSRTLGIPVVAAHDAHYLDAADAGLHGTMLNVNTQGRSEGFETPEFYLRSRAEMAAAGLEGAWLDRTLEIADGCNVTLDLGKTRFPRPAGVPDGVDAMAWMTKLAFRGLDAKYGTDHATSLDERLTHELGVIEKTGYVNYLLCVADLMRFCRERGIPSSVRGSAAGSLVLYCLGVTSVDPMAFNLSFARFLNEGREPDVDVDVSDRRRGELFKYAADTYGPDRVAHILTYTQAKPRSAVRDVCRALGYTTDSADLLAKLIPEHAKTLDEAVLHEPRLGNLPAAEQTVLDTAARLLGVPRHTGVHAAGLVIADVSLTDLMATQRGKDDGSVAVQGDMEDCARAGLVKLDVLGLANLTIIEDTVALVRARRGIAIDIHAIPFTDQATYDLLGDGETLGVFQLSSRGMRGHIRQLRPSRIEDIQAMVALYRPGPMPIIPQYIARKHGEAPEDVIHPSLAPILAQTHGLLVYQEAVLDIAQQLAGFTPYEADQMLGAVRKKKADVLAKWEPRFRDGLREHGKWDDEAIESLWQTILPWSSYAFNSSHAAEYARVAYITAYLKSHYSCEFMTALLTSEAAGSDATEKVALAVQECRRLGVPVYAPDVNRSGAGFSIDGPGVRFGLGAVKGVGPVAVKTVLEKRNSGPFLHLDDIRARCGSKVNVKVLEALVVSGALDGLGDRRSHLAALGKEPVRWRTVDRLAREREVLGLTTSDSPLAPYALAIEQVRDTLAAEVRLSDVGTWVTIAGEVTGWRAFKTKKGVDMGGAEVTDDTGTAAVVVFPRQFTRMSAHLEPGKIVAINGKVGAYEKQAQLVAERVVWTA